MSRLFALFLAAIFLVEFEVQANFKDLIPSTQSSVALTAKVPNSIDPRDSGMTKFAYHNGVAVGGYWLARRLEQRLVRGKSVELPSQTGEAYVFERTNDGLKQRSLYSLIPEDARLPLGAQGFGFSVSIFNDTIAVGTSSGKLVYLFKKSQAGWKFQTRLSIENAISFGNSLALYDRKLIVGAPYFGSEKGAGTGAAFIFEQTDGGAWDLRQQIIGQSQSERLGWSVAASEAGFLVGCPGSQKAILIAADGTRKELLPIAESGAIEKLSQFGISVALSDKTAAVGAHTAGGSLGAPVGSGKVFVYSLDRPIQPIELSVPTTGERKAVEYWFGKAVALGKTKEGSELLAVGAPGEDRAPQEGKNHGGVYVYEHLASKGWVQIDKFAEAKSASGSEIRMGSDVGFFEDRVFATSPAVRKIFISPPESLQELSKKSCAGYLADGTRLLSPHLKKTR